LRAFGRLFRELSDGRDGRHVLALWEIESHLFVYLNIYHVVIYGWARVYSLTLFQHLDQMPKLFNV
jgi:hypothetical protein